ncbi:MAG: TonB-dependent receptor, partial [Myxococcota bacterium]
DNNLGALPSGNVIDASVAFSVFNLANTGFDPTFTLYGRNLANEAFLGGQTPLPPALAEGAPPLGGNFSPLKEGRVLGAEMRVDF